MTFEVDHLTLELGGRAVIRDLSFSVQPGERVVILGVNGSGKTALMKALDGLHFGSAGAVRYRGVALGPGSLGEASFRRRFRSEVALLFQQVDAMLFHPTVADEIAFGPRQLSLPDVGERVERWARQFGVEGLLDRPPFELSGGEKKRVALAALMAVGPQVLLLDEATASLDPAAAGRLVDYLATLEGTTVIASTQNLSVAAEPGSRAILLAPGRPGACFERPTSGLLADERLLVDSGLAHRHAHRHGAVDHAHFHVHDID